MFWIMPARPLMTAIVLLALYATSASRGDEPAPRQIVADPTEIRVTGIGGEKVKRLISLTLTGKPDLSSVTLRTTNLRAVEGDDAEQALPIELKNKTTKLRGGAPDEVFMIFDLKGLSHGEYKGKLQVLDGEDVVKELPLTVQVRNPWHWPLFVLLSGVLLGLGISWYRSRGQTQDQLLSRIDDLGDRVNDTTIRQEFRDAMDAKIAEAREALQKADMDAASKALDQGEAIEFRWSTKRAEWEDLFTYIRTLSIELLQFPASSKTVEFVLESIHDASRRAPLQDTTDSLRSNLTGWRHQVERFGDLQELLGGLDLRRRAATPKIASAWEGRIDTLKQRLNRLEPSDATGFQALNTDIIAASHELDEAISQAQTPPAIPLAPGERASPPQVGSSAPTGSPDVELSGVPSAPASSRLGRASSGLFSYNLPRMGRYIYKLRLALFRWFGYIAPVAVFVYTGMNQFYQGNPTFGTLSQYVALFLWGFGADASGTKVQDLIRNASNRTPLANPTPPDPKLG